MSDAVGFNLYTNSVILSNGEEVQMINWIKYWEVQHKHFIDLMLAKDFISKRDSKVRG